MSHSAKEHNWYLTAFERFAQHGHGPTWTAQVRQAAIARFADLGFPTTRHEEWKYTNVAPIVKTDFELAGPEQNGLTAERFAAVRLKGEGCPQLVFVNGHYVEELSWLGALSPRVHVASLATALRTTPDLLEPYLAHYACYRDQAFVALNTAFMEDGAFVHLLPGQVLEHPIHLVFVSTDTARPHVWHPRNLLIVDAGSQVTLVEHYVGLRQNRYLTNAVTELVLGEDAVVDHYKLQQESPTGFHMGTLQVQQDQQSVFSSYAFDLGGSLARNDLNTTLAGEGSQCSLTGLYLVGDRQHVDNHTRIDHARPFCTSRELYKGVLGGKARGVFNGKIVVHTDARRTDAIQTNNNLLLSEEALVDSKPQLEIFNNDVRCSHGSTTGQLDQEALFYLRSRGLDLPTARRVLTHAFAHEIIDRIKIEPLRAQLDTLLQTTLSAVY